MRNDESQEGNEGQEVTDAAHNLAVEIQRRARTRQAGIVRGLKGKYVRRNGVTFLVVSVNRKRIVLSNVDTETDQTWQVGIPAFLSKKVTVLADGK